MNFLSPSRAAFLILCLGLAACGTSALAPQTADELAASADMRRQTTPTTFFTLTSYARIADVNRPLTVYIEGEDSPFSIAAAIDPTPAGLPGLRLALLDPSPNLLYIARPCQMIAGDPLCDVPSLRSGRYADLVYHSVARVIDRTLAPFPQPRLHLVGLGNGGALAALLAERRPDIASLRTLGGNLDPNGLARARGYDGADDLIDPMPAARRLASLPQIHYVGDRDEAVPGFLASNFIAEIGKSFCVALVRVPEADHTGGWNAFWAQNAAKIPVCDRLSRPQTSPDSILAPAAPFSNPAADAIVAGEAY